MEIMVRVTGEGAYFAVKPELASVERTALPPPPVSVSIYLSLSIFTRKSFPSLTTRETFPLLLPCTRPSLVACLCHRRR
ncbi:hypothetical protein TIFTF001_032683 [Ficus carica]|uniref:Uncharacterized protein n=1 Tax=Ficus carica TaxID=3494 RepID=A0AA88J2Q3_FICCA|nr:hypothetical protein TIFTF001_032683 [Ficus carica]